VAVHGLWRDVTTWKDYPGFIESVRDEWEFYGVGDEQYSGVMDTGVTGQPGDVRIAANSLILHNYAEQMRNDRGAVHFDLLGHSMGGLISRHFIQSYMGESPDDGPLAKRLVMLGTPHEGSTLADTMFLVLEKGNREFGTRYPDNLLEFTPAYLSIVFNPRIRNARGVAFSVAAGSPGIVPFIGGSILRLELPNDGIVPVSSARAFNTASLTFKHERVVDSNHVDQTGNALVFQNYSFPILAGLDPAPPAEFAALPASSSEAADIPLEEESQIVTFADTIQVGPNATVDIPVTMTAARAVGIIVVDLPTVGSSILDASNNAVAATSILPGEWGAFTRSHIIESPMAGTYRVRLENRSNETAFVGMAAIELGNPAALSATAALDGNGDLQIEASISGIAATPDVVTAQIIGHDATSTTLPLTGTGPYTGSLTDLGARLFEIVIEARFPDGFGIIGPTAITALGDASLKQSPLPNGNLLCSWPVDLGPDVVRKSSLGMEPPQWTPIAMLPELVGARYMIEITPIDPAEIFRLRLGAAVPLEPMIDTSLLRHTADTDQDSKIGLSEVLRVIELYNTRQSTTRTGRYRINEGAVDGFETDRDAVIDSPLTLIRFHAADTNRDARINLSEPLRLMEIYNTRRGTVRTGRYRPQTGTVDGFAPDIENP
jgi:pimeloyl-ACP methyl ester carboxylesterase